MGSWMPHSCWCAELPRWMRDGAGAATKLRNSSRGTAQRKGNERLFPSAADAGAQLTIRSVNLSSGDKAESPFHRRPRRCAGDPPKMPGLDIRRTKFEFPFDSVSFPRFSTRSPSLSSRLYRSTVYPLVSGNFVLSLRARIRPFSSRLPRDSLDFSTNLSLRVRLPQ